MNFRGVGIPAILVALLEDAYREGQPAQRAAARAGVSKSLASRYFHDFQSARVPRAVPWPGKAGRPPGPGRSPRRRPRFPGLPVYDGPDLIG